MCKEGDRTGVRESPFSGRREGRRGVGMGASRGKRGGQRGQRPVKEAKDGKSEGVIRVSRGVKGSAALVVGGLNSGVSPASVHLELRALPQSAAPVHR